MVPRVITLIRVEHEFVFQFPKNLIDLRVVIFAGMAELDYALVAPQRLFTSRGRSQLRDGPCSSIAGPAIAGISKTDRNVLVPLLRA